MVPIPSGDVGIVPGAEVTCPASATCGLNQAHKVRIVGSHRPHTILSGLSPGERGAMANFTATATLGRFVVKDVPNHARHVRYPYQPEFLHRCDTQGGNNLHMCRLYQNIPNGAVWHE